MRESFRSWLRTETIDSEHNGQPITYVFAEDRASLLYLVNLGCIDHNPWMSRSPHLDNPDFVLIDLDPQECPYDRIVEAALLVKRMLDRIGLAGYPKTTGGDGMHVYVPVEPVYSYEETRTFAELIARLAVAEKPDLFTTPRRFPNGRKTACISTTCRTRNRRPSPRPMCCAPIRARRWPRRWNGRRCGRAASRAIHHRQRARAIRGPRAICSPACSNKPQRLEEALEKLEKLLR